MLRIKTAKELTEISEIFEGGFLVRRFQKLPHAKSIVDVFSDFWSIAVARHIPRGSLYLHRHGRSIELCGTVGVFIPPFSILDWSVCSAPYEWTAVLIEGPPPSHAPKEACLFELAPERFSEDPETLLGLLNGLSMRCLVGKEELVTPLAYKVKSYIDQHRFESFSFHQMAADLNCSLGSTSRAFKKCFGVTPVFYRNQLRVFRASLMLAKGSNVTDAGYGVGFYDLSRFNKQFKEKMKVVPSAYRSSDLSY